MSEAAATATPGDFVGSALALTPEDMAAAATMLAVSPAHIRALMAVESRGRGFDPRARRPIILFEPHVFHRLTGGRFDATHPDLSYPSWGMRPYPPSQDLRWSQLGRARALSADAALKSASWGLFQLMGFNHRAAGFAAVQDFAIAMARSEGEQLAAAARFIGGEPLMLGALRRADWAGFARAYNGPGFAQHGYDQKLKAAFAAAQTPQPPILQGT